MNVANFRERLPVRFERNFRPASYQVGHQQLILRSTGNARAGETVSITFAGVQGMKIKSHYPGLVIAEATDVEDIDRFVDIPERHSAKFMRLSVSSGSYEGFVVCGTLNYRTDKLPDVIDPRNPPRELDPFG